MPDDSSKFKGYHNLNKLSLPNDIPVAPLHTHTHSWACIDYTQALYIPTQPPPHTQKSCLYPHQSMRGKSQSLEPQEIAADYWVMVPPAPKPGWRAWKRNVNLECVWTQTWHLGNPQLQKLLGLLEGCSEGGKAGLIGRWILASIFSCHHQSISQKPSLGSWRENKAKQINKTNRFLLQKPAIIGIKWLFSYFLLNKKHDIFGKMYILWE